MTVENGRPGNCAGRVENEIKSYDFLEREGVSFLRADHEPAYGMDICAELSKALGAPICKNLFLCNRQETEFYLLMLPCDKKFKTKDITTQIGSARLSFANETYMWDLLGVTPGSVTVLGLMFDTQKRVRLLIDRDMVEGHNSVGIHPCKNTSTLKVSVDDLLHKIIPALGHEPTFVSLPWYMDEPQPAEAAAKD